LIGDRWKLGENDFLISGKYSDFVNTEELVSMPVCPDPPCRFNVTKCWEESRQMNISHLKAFGNEE